MPFETVDGVEVMYRWVDDDRVDIGHFLVQGGFRQGAGSNAMETLLQRFEQEGASTVTVTIGGGEETEAFLRERGFTVRAIREDGAVRARYEFQ